MLLCGFTGLRPYFQLGQGIRLLRLKLTQDTKGGDSMLLILDGNSEMNAHVRSVSVFDLLKTFFMSESHRVALYISIIFIYGESSRKFTQLFFIA